jgi:hypothetical protein
LMPSLFQENFPADTFTQTPGRSSRCSPSTSTRRTTLGKPDAQRLPANHVSTNYSWIHLARWCHCPNPRISSQRPRYLFLCYSHQHYERIPPQQCQSDVEATYQTSLSISTWTPTAQRQQLYSLHFALSNSSWQSTHEVLPLAMYHDYTLFLTTKASQRTTLSGHSAKKLQYLTIWSLIMTYFKEFKEN